jgi:hypothetical protein
MNDVEMIAGTWFSSAWGLKHFLMHFLLLLLPFWSNILTAPKLFFQRFFNFSEHFFD